MFALGIYTNSSTCMMGLDYVAGGGKSERGAPVFDTEIGLHEEREGK